MFTLIAAKEDFWAGKEFVTPPGFDMLHLARGTLSNDMPFWVYWTTDAPLPQFIPAEFTVYTFDNYLSLGRFDYEVLWAVKNLMPKEQFDALYEDYEAGLSH
jgi:hypothetical protein